MNRTTQHRWNWIGGLLLFGNFGLNQIEFDGFGDGLGAAVYGKAAEDAANVVLDGVFAEIEYLPDFPIGFAAADPAQHFQFALG